MNTLQFSQYKKAWLAQRPDTIPKRNNSAKVAWVKLLFMGIALVAINIVSGSHTIPTVANTIHSASIELRTIVGIAGFLSIEFTLFLMMIAPVPGNTRRLVIFLALLAAIVANLYSTTKAISGDDNWTLIVGVVLGLFGPLANVAFGEVFRHEFDSTAAANTEREKVYQDAVSALNSTIRGQYTQYLKKCGITDPTAILQYISDSGSDTGSVSVQISPDTVLPLSDSMPSWDSNISDTDITEQQYRLPVVPDRVQRYPVAPVVRTASSDSRTTGNSGGTTLAEQLVANGDTRLSYNDIRAKYRVGPNTVAAAKKILKGQ